MAELLKAGDRAVANSGRRAHVVREVAGGIALTLCREVSLWAEIGDSGYGYTSRLADVNDSTCKTCEKRAAAAERRAEKEKS